MIKAEICACKHGDPKVSAMLDVAWSFFPHYPIFFSIESVKKSRHYTKIPKPPGCAVKLPLKKSRALGLSTLPTVALFFGFLVSSNMAI